MNTNTHTHANTHTHTHAHSHVHMHIYNACACICTRARAHTHTHTHSTKWMTKILPVTAACTWEFSAVARSAVTAGLSWGHFLSDPVKKTHQCTSSLLLLGIPCSGHISPIISASMQANAPAHTHTHPHMCTHTHAHVHTHTHTAFSHLKRRQKTQLTAFFHLKHKSMTDKRFNSQHFPTSDTSQWRAKDSTHSIFPSETQVNGRQDSTHNIFPLETQVNGRQKIQLTAFSADFSHLMQESIMLRRTCNRDNVGQFTTESFHCCSLFSATVSFFSSGKKEAANNLKPISHFHVNLNLLLVILPKTLRVEKTSKPLLTISRSNYWRK